MKKRKITEGRKASKASKENKTGPCFPFRICNRLEIMAIMRL